MEHDQHKCQIRINIKEAKLASAFQFRDNKSPLVNVGTY
jgi:hypothetical protein